MILSVVLFFLICKLLLLAIFYCIHLLFYSIIDEYYFYKLAIPQQLPSHATVISMRQYYHFTDNILVCKEIFCLCQRNHSLVLYYKFLFLYPFVLGTSNKIFYLKYNKPAEQEVAENIE
ncbi:hypothetical protein PHYBLDRAFT_175185 [Phycomyces blakesleeanus NRRL 1555(-)]|uniref:Uncharacterized protein n=1 Tax=Phycomyces blakesleeanus (strain ATCC 8743b / DSM 1359 / FGSC 10004 / NBRC 33097 / NRRL 1555) TaxID=763407 RepID=A0A162N733_PHYB8|nr:hypothetical protein PHYBLDRAFT_175183 [Phycomyces blakesleeanus NRRL 1555(-)]XP_018284414.1 hypothetical protein PHYBLDRAFT_175185 [Phycomyces blakesleeanus NRRL 1555(-)]OAD66373.1 hypothetical protein PHYBLDRAFT_175183 [Phycomyces blakesleeanus NRRL 1555(-)]OAD66374.1 hypothetical protein PHYBLDRAFT_175185 [Phycomyces blakesleeanus NRRL 1555(-)]|eukprot:XP_018284413.1 hypothetical protein PHYBLDRAFT_175183 [Phycomyces blakesleeanus NRRL 1555(-)]